MTDLNDIIVANALRNRRRKVIFRGQTSAPPGATDPMVAAINAEGWSVTATSPPTLDPVGAPRYVVANRAGFDTSGTPNSVSETLILTQRVRQAFPNNASLDASRVAMSDYLYSTDTVTGVANNSTEASPRPIANWAMTDRRVVGDILPRELLEVVAFHRNARQGEQVACVEWTITDGTTTLTVRRSVSEVSGHPGDRNAVIVYRPAADVNISGLNDQANITVNCKVYPWIGDAASVMDSASLSGGREFSPRIFRRWTARASAPPLAYVATTPGATPTVSTDPAIAAANPYGTPMAALEALRTFTGSQVDGCEIRLMAGTHVWSATVAAGTYTVNAEVVITRDPNVTRSAAILSFGSVSNYSTRCNWFRYSDISLLRTGAFTIAGIAGGQVVMENCAFDNGGFSATWINLSAGGAVIGCDLTNPGAALFNAGAPENRLMRGLSGTGMGSVEGWLVLGCALTGANLAFVRGARTGDRSIMAYNRLTTGGTGMVGRAMDEAILNGSAIVQNVMEFTSATSNPLARLSADSATGNLNHLVMHHNTLAGSFIHGRSNNFYDDGPTPRTCKLQSMVGNIQVQINTKGDVFDSAATRLGNWGYLYGAGCRGEFSQFIDAQSGGIGGNFAQAYPGLNASIGTSSTVRNDPLFVDFEATAVGGVAGAGGGDYRLQAGTPAAGRVTERVLAFDLDGNARTGAQASGAYRFT